MAALALMAACVCVCVWVCVCSFICLQLNKVLLNMFWSTHAFVLACTDQFYCSGSLILMAALLTMPSALHYATVQVDSLLKYCGW